MLRSGSSYLSQSEMPLTFGLGRAQKVGSVEITWPSGAKEKVQGSPGTLITVQEGKGVIRSTALTGTVQR